MPGSDATNRFVARRSLFPQPSCSSRVEYYSALVLQSGYGSTANKRWNAPCRFQLQLAARRLGFAHERRGLKPQRKARKETQSRRILIHREALNHHATLNHLQPRRGSRIPAQGASLRATLGKPPPPFPNPEMGCAGLPPLVLQPSTVDPPAPPIYPPHAEIRIGNRYAPRSGSAPGTQAKSQPYERSRVDFDRKLSISYLHETG